jgi:hypothetical protein
MDPVWADTVDGVHTSCDNVTGVAAD